METIQCNVDGVNVENRYYLLYGILSGTLLNNY